MNEVLLPGNLSLKKLAKKHGLSYNKAWRSIKEHFTEQPAPRTNIYDCLKQVNLKQFVEEKYFSSNFVSMEWGPLMTELKVRYPILNSYANKSLENAIRKCRDLRAVSIKRKPANFNSRILLQRQLLVGSLILQLHSHGDPMCFFDETILSEKNFKKTAIGNSILMPLVANYSISKLYCLVMFSLDGKVAFQFSTVPNTSNATVAFFKQAIPKSIDTNSQKKLTIVLDNAAVQKTAELKGLVDVFPINLLYNIPCSPFLNPVEDFFMEIKKSFKTHYHQQRENCLFGMLQSFKNVIKRGDFDWMIRKMAVNLQRRLQVHGFDC